MIRFGDLEGWRGFRVTYPIHFTSSYFPLICYTPLTPSNPPPLHFTTKTVVEGWRRESRRHLYLHSGLSGHNIHVKNRIM